MALAARCNVIVALNKVDRIPAGAERTAARSRVLAQLLQLGLVPEEYGGKEIVCWAIYIASMMMRGEREDKIR